MSFESPNHEYVGPEEVGMEMRRAARTSSTPPAVRKLCRSVLRERREFGDWAEPLFDIDNKRAVKMAEKAGDLEEYAAFTLRILRRAGSYEECVKGDDDPDNLATDEELESEAVEALAACRRYYWTVRNAKPWQKP
jgi:hypothetical protein